MERRGEGDASRGAARGRTVLVSIQTLRGLAALGVIMHHQLQGIVPGAKFGEYGVDLFFAISGFIMTCLAEDRSVTPARFVLDRICRIVPSYWVATALTVALYQVGVFDPRVAAPGGWHLLLSLLFIPDPNPTGQLWPTLFLGWTLNYEAFFYAVFAVVLLLRPGLRLACLAAILLGLVTLGQIWPDKGPLAQVYTHPRMAEFLAGAMLGDAFGLTLKRRPDGAAFARAAGALAGLAIVVTLTGLPALVVAAVSVVALALLIERQGRFPTSRLLLVLGGASYSIYIFQQIAFDLSDRSFLHLAQAGIVLPAGLHAERWTAALSAVAFGWLCHVVIERPLTSRARTLLARLTGRQTWLAARPKPAGVEDAVEPRRTGPGRPVAQPAATTPE